MQLHSLDWSLGCTTSLAAPAPATAGLLVQLAMICARGSCLAACHTLSSGPYATLMRGLKNTGLSIGSRLTSPTYSDSRPSGHCLPARASSATA